MPSSPPSAPWKLNGSGYIFLYQLTQDHIDTTNSVEPWLAPHRTGDLSALMVFDWRQTPVGPYREMVFAPGRYKWAGRRYYHFARQYVTSPDAAAYGPKLWGTPDTLAEIDIVREDERTKTITVNHNSKAIFNASVTDGLLRFPFNTFFNPFRVKLLQRHPDDGKTLSIEPRAGGTLSLTGTLESITTNGGGLPSLDSLKPLALVEAVSLRLTFPIPLTVEANA
ncbi:MAG: acetoacetate decarboxylase family protein [Chloroflexota bacterium]